MTAPPPMDKSRLAAFVDGALTPEEAAAVVMHLADHPEDQAYVDDLMAANTALARAFARPMTEPVPEAIRAAIDGVPQAQVLPFRPRRAALAFGGLALAASAVLALVLVPEPAPQGLVLGPVASGSALHDHLQRLPSGQTVDLADGAELTILATLPTRSGPCREVEVIDRVAGRLDLLLACKPGSGWQVEVALAEPLPEGVEDEGFVPAGGMETAGLTPWLDQREAGMALDAAAEAALIARGWAP